MPKKTFQIIIAFLLLILFLIIGGVYTFLSFETLTNIGIDFGLESMTLKMIGVILIITGFALFFLTLLTDFLRKFKMWGQKYWYAFILFDIVKWILIVILGLFFLGGGVKIGQSILGKLQDIPFF